MPRCGPKYGNLVTGSCCIRISQCFAVYVGATGAPHRQRAEEVGEPESVPGDCHSDQPALAPTLVAWARHGRCAVLAARAEVREENPGAAAGPWTASGDSGWCRRDLLLPSSARDRGHRCGAWGWHGRAVPPVPMRTGHRSDCLCKGRGPATEHGRRGVLRGLGCGELVRPLDPVGDPILGCTGAAAAVLGVEHGRAPAVRVGGAVGAAVGPGAAVVAPVGPAGGRDVVIHPRIFMDHRRKVAPPEGMNRTCHFAMTSTNQYLILGTG